MLRSGSLEPEKVVLLSPLKPVSSNGKEYIMLLNALNPGKTTPSSLFSFVYTVQPASLLRTRLFVRPLHLADEVLLFPQDPVPSLALSNVSVVHRRLLRVHPAEIADSSLR